jgi:hypothetical protein
VELAFLTLDQRMRAAAAVVRIPRQVQRVDLASAGLVAMQRHQAPMAVHLPDRAAVVAAQVAQVLPAVAAMAQAA